MSLNVKLPALHPGQQRIENGRRRFTIVRCGRQFGKSLYASIRAITAACADSNQVIIVVAPTFKQTQAIYGRIRRLIKPLMGYDMGDGTVFASEYKADYRIEFYNGSMIMAASSDNPDKLRGYSINLIIFDEAAVMDNGPELWFEVVRPALAVTKGSAMFLSTPKGKDNWFYDLWRNAEADIADKGADSEWAIFHARSTDSPFFGQEESDAIRAIGENYWLQECQAEFTATKGTIIGLENFKTYTMSISDGTVYYLYGSRVYPEASCYRAMTVDLAVSQRTTADFTSFALGDITRDGMCFVRDVTQDRILGPDLATKIRAYSKVNHVQVVHVENVAFQLAVIQELQLLGVTVKPLVAKGDKVARATALGIRMNAGQTVFPEQAAWLPRFKDEVTSFDGSGATHDDQVDSVGYLSLTAAEYAMYASPSQFGSVTLEQVANIAPGEDSGVFRDNIRAEKKRKAAERNSTDGGMWLEKMRGPL